MNGVAALTVVLMAGIAIGGFFFGGLWWTIQKGLSSKNPVFWFFGSTLLRLGLALAGFYFIARSDWRKWLICMLGFLIARVVVTRLTRTNKQGIDAP
jgi:F1F0 ATPase subunit 2